MKTNDLIHVLSKDASIGVQKRPFFTLVLLGIVASTILMFIFASTPVFSVRPNYLSALTENFVAFKQIYPLLLAGLLFSLVQRARFPETNLSVSNFGRILPAIVLVGALFTIAFFQTPKDALFMALQGKSMQYCLTLVPVFSIPTFIALLNYFRNSAPSAPVSTGFGAGLFAGALGCFVYAFLCVDDNPLFWVWAYSLGVLISGILGAVVGNFLLKW